MQYIPYNCHSRYSHHPYSSVASSTIAVRLVVAWLSVLLPATAVLDPSASLLPKLPKLQLDSRELGSTVLLDGPAVTSDSVAVSAGGLGDEAVGAVEVDGAVGAEDGGVAVSEDVC